jgi:hypothetical protein
MYRHIRHGEELPLGMPGPAAGIFRVSGRDRTVVTMARHVRSPQLLAAIDGRRWGIWLAPRGDAPVGPIWVEVAPGEALLLETGTWHHGPIPLEEADGVYLTVEAPDTNRVDFEQQAVVRAIG